MFHSRLSQTSDNEGLCNAQIFWIVPIETDICQLMLWKYVLSELGKTHSNSMYNDTLILRGNLAAPG